MIRPISTIGVLALLIASGAQITIDVGIVPIVLTTFFIYMGALLFGARIALAATIVYLLAGVSGLPVFAGGTSGLDRLFGPTGGYLFGFMMAAFAAGTIAWKSNSAVQDVLALITGAIIIHSSGLLWLWFYSPEAWTQTAGMYHVYMTAEAVRLTVVFTISRALKSRFDLSKWVSPKS